MARWTGWFAGVVGWFLIAQFVVSRDVVPALIYLAPLPAGVAALIRALRLARISRWASISASTDSRAVPALLAVVIRAGTLASCGLG